MEDELMGGVDIEKSVDEMIIRWNELKDSPLGQELIKNRDGIMKNMSQNLSDNFVDEHQIHIKKNKKVALKILSELFYKSMHYDSERLMKVAIDSGKFEKWDNKLPQGKTN